MQLRNARVWRAAARAKRTLGALRGTLRRRTPRVSVVVILYNISRESPRTLLSLSATYQRHIAPEDYEVIVIDNGSQPAVDPALISKMAGNFRLIRIDNAAPSPAAAVNRGLAEARGDIIGVMIDGARIASPGLLHFALQGAQLYDHAVVAALGWYLGRDLQRFAMRAGYDQAREDSLLASIGWPQDGYRLFEIATLDESSINGWLAPIAESNGLFLRRASWNLLGGVDERFDLPGGGLANLDTFRRAVELPDAQLVVLLGEGTFHQLHGGVATNVPADALGDGWTRWESQYRAIRGRPYELPRPKNPPTYLGTLPGPVLSRFVRAALHPIARDTPPLGPHFHTGVWSNLPLSPPTNPALAPLIELAHAELRAGNDAAAAAVARVIRAHAPDEAEPQRLLSLTAGSLSADHPPEHLRVAHHVALGDAHRLLGENEAAATHYRAALSLEANLVRAHVGLATMRMPGDFYYEWLDRLYGALKPETIIEIGVAEGRSLAYARPPTVAIGVDPTPKLLFPPRTETHIFAETSDAFFDRRGPDALLRGRPLGIGFIDGLHLYEQALKDFINLEPYCGPRSVILFHDMIPLDERTQRRSCDTQFHTGDVWKVVLCLKHYRADLDIFTIATPWTGLTVVTGLNPAARQLADNYEEAVARFIDTPFAAIESCAGTALNIVPNEWEFVEARLRKVGIL
jgi:glycosyltransferase involved in cell wall biosynthesis